MPFVESYTYGSSDVAHISTNRLEVDEQGGGAVVAVLTSPAVFSDALTAFAFNLNASSAATYSIHYDATARRVTITQAAGLGFKPTFSGVGGAQIAAWLGFDSSASYAYAAAHQGTLPPAGRLECLGIECQPPQDASRVAIEKYRLGRAIAPTFGNHSVFDLQLVFKTATATANWAWFSTGRVRAYISASAAVYSPSNLGGYVDGYIRQTDAPEMLGQDEGLVSLPMVVAVPR